MLNGRPPMGIRFEYLRVGTGAHELWNDNCYYPR